MFISKKLVVFAFLFGSLSSSMPMLAMQASQTITQKIEDAIVGDRKREVHLLLGIYAQKNKLNLGDALNAPIIISQREGMRDIVATPLAFAVFVESLGTVQELLARGANPNITDEAGLSLERVELLPLQYAYQKENKAVIKLLLSHGATPLSQRQLNHINQSCTNSLRCSKIYNDALKEVEDECSQVAGDALQNLLPIPGVAAIAHQYAFANKKTNSL